MSLGEVDWDLDFYYLYDSYNFSRCVVLEYMSSGLRLWLDYYNFK